MENGPEQIEGYNTCVSRTKYQFLIYQAGRCRNVLGPLNTSECGPLDHSSQIIGNS